MAGLGEAAWRLYQASPPALLAVLVVTVTYGGRYVVKEIHSLHDRFDDVDQRVAEHEMLIDNHDTRLEREREARKRNDRRIQKLLQNQAAEHGNVDPLDQSGGD